MSLLYPFVQIQNLLHIDTQQPKQRPDCDADITSVHYSTTDIKYNVLNKSSMLRLLPRPPNRLDEVFGSNSLSACEVTRSNFRVNFNSRVHRNKVF